MGYDWVVVGAGLTGVTFARRLAEAAGLRVLVVDERDHVGGNVYDEPDAHGVLVQRYGAHIFHTGSALVFDYLTQFTQWFPYEHRVLARVGDALVPVPFNFTSLETLLPERAPRLREALLREFPADARVPVAKLLASTDADVRDVGEFVVESVFRGYTAKQWGRPLEAVDPAVLARVPVAVGYDDRYFRDAYQAIPRDGYAAMVRRMLDHPNITVALETAGAPLLHLGERALWTGRIDAYFDFSLGRLPYRSLRFENVPGRWRELPVAVVNHPGAEPYTRVIDHSHFSPAEATGTTLSYEHPAAYEPSVNEPFYPVSDAASQELYEAYAAQAAGRDVLFAGRLGDFRYYDMHQAVARALTLADAVRQGRGDPHQHARAQRTGTPA
jgi:UDP-galactopyranose mutase